MGKVGFIGLGNIGLPMAKSLIREGIEVIAFDRRVEILEEVKNAGGTAAGDVAEIVSTAQTIGIAVVNDAQVRSVIDSILNSGSGERTVETIIIHSTILPSTVSEVHERLDKEGIGLLDAQVSGGDLRAADGTLAVMVGGDGARFESHSHYFAAIGSTVRHMGASGTGAATKLAMQGMTYINQLVALEAARFATSYGIEESALMEMAEATTGQSFMTSNWGFFDRQLFVHTMTGTEELYRLYDKDLMNLCLSAREKAIDMPISGLAQQLLGPRFKERKRLLEEAGVEFKK